MPDNESEIKISPVKAGLLCKCPKYGKGKIYQNLITNSVHFEACRVCLAKSDSRAGPAVLIVFLFGLIFIPLAILIELSFEPPIWVHAIFWPFLIIGGSIALLQPLKGLMVALQYHHKASDSGSVDYD